MSDAAFAPAMAADGCLSDGNTACILPKRFQIPKIGIFHP